MPEIKSYRLFVLLAILQLSLSQRRIKDGLEVTSDKRYAVYLLKAPNAPVQYLDWTCGGAIVSRSFVITAAACVNDLHRMYVIAGYKKFVSSLQLEENECTNKMKKRVIFTCVPKDYHLDYQKTESWARIDIGVVKTESPFDFTDKSFEKYCSYIPAPIKVNYALKFQAPGTDALALGWGHTKQFKENLKNISYNHDTIQYAATKILDKKTCLSYFPLDKNMWSTIRSYMICTLETGKLNDKGNLIVKSQPTGCITEEEKTMGRMGIMCAGDNKGSRSKMIRDGDNKQDGVNEAIQAQVLEVTSIKNNETVTLGLEGGDMVAKETPGICQNDHGGPLVTWVGAHEILIGVATLYKLDDESRCIGPYLFTSTSCNSAFLNCILSMENETETGRRCENPEEHTFKMVKQKISWDENLPVWPAENGIVYKRPQVPIN